MTHSDIAEYAKPLPPVPERVVRSSGYVSGEERLRRSLADLTPRRKAIPELSPRAHGVHGACCQRFGGVKKSEEGWGARRRGIKVEGKVPWFLLLFLPPVYRRAEPMVSLSINIEGNFSGVG